MVQLRCTALRLRKRLYSVSGLGPAPQAENVDLWSSCTLRYAGHHLALAELAAQAGEVAPAAGGAPLAAQQPSPLQLLVDSVAEPVPEGATSAQVTPGWSSGLL